MSTPQPSRRGTVIKRQSARSFIVDGSTVRRGKEFVCFVSRGKDNLPWAARIADALNVAAGVTVSS